MPPSMTKLEPWIEKLILSYGTEQQKTKSGRLKAHVVGVGPMAFSQQAQGQGAQGGLTDLIFLSDGVVQMPALLTASAWEDLQEREDRDCLSSLVDTTVCVQSYRLQFHMNPEQTRCRFFLSVGKLATVAAGPPNDITPSCTILAPVRQQICKTWGSLLPDLPHGPSASQNTFESIFDLSNLLGAWQHDAMNSVLVSIQNGLRVAPPFPVSSPQPSTSSCNPPTTSHHADTYTGWDADRIRYKSVEQFNIPACHLLMPEEEVQRPQIALEQGSETPSGILNPPEVTDLPNTVQPILGHFNTNAFPPEILERCSLGSEDTQFQDDVVNEDTITESNPWDAFSPPFATSSCSGESITSEAIPPKALTDTTGIALQLGGVPLVAITQMSSRGSSESSQTSKEQTSGIPPYQKPQSTPCRVPVSNSSSASGSATEPMGRTLMLNRCSPLLVSDQENLQVEEEMETQEEVAQRKCRAVKRKINHMLPALERKEEGVPSSGSPPSWLFETQRASRAELRSRLKQTKSMGTVSGVHSTVHSDGAQFSYAYKSTGQLLQDLSKFKVADDMLHWAVKYLTVQTAQTDKAHNLVSEQC